MRNIRACSSCAGPVTIKMVRCPNCNGSQRPRPAGPRGLVGRRLVGGLTVSSTLAACYGAPCADDRDPDCRRYVPTCDDAVSMQPQIDDMDGDGYCKLDDCNEKDRKINAAARDSSGDGIDQNCDGKDADDPR